MAIDPVIAEILRCQGKLEAKVEMLESQLAEMRGEEASESEDEGEIEMPEGNQELATNPAIYSNQLEFDIPPIF